MTGNKAAWRHLPAHLRPHWRTVLAGGVLGLLGGASGLVLPLAAKVVVDSLLGQRALLAPVLLLAGAAIVGAVLTAGSRYLLERTGENVVRRVRDQLSGWILGLRVGAMDRLQPGDLMSRLTSDVTLLRSVTANAVVNAVTGLVMGIGAIVLLALTDLVLVGVTAGVLLVSCLAFAATMPRIAAANQRMQVAIGRLAAVTERALGAFRTVKANGTERRELSRAVDASAEAWRHGLRVARLQAVVGVAGTLSTQVTFIAVLGIGAARVGAGALTLSSLIAFLLCLTYLSGPVGQVVSSVAQWQAGLAAVRRLTEVEAMPREPAGRDDVAPGAGHRPVAVAFTGVTFGYLPGTPVLHDVTVEVPAGGMTAIVGPSGSGKSTFFALLQRFYEAQRGDVAVDGRDVRQWPLDELRAAIGYVEQDAPVLAGTLRENLRYGAPAATDEQIHAVLRRARLTTLLDQLPDGLDTVVGHRGTTLSGGQRQRVAIARALLRRPRLLLLDEITSQLDAANEAALREAVEDIAVGTTVIVVAHRLSTVINSDRIVVLDAGRVRAVGTHRGLVESDELYRELAAGQLIIAGEGARS
jgi:ABC-type multidrug transport system fused ATPase/permease subunit